MCWYFVCTHFLSLSLAVVFYWYSGEYIQQVFCHLLSSWIFTLWDSQRFSLRRGPSLATSCLIREMVDFIVRWRVSGERESRQWEQERVTDIAKCHRALVIWQTWYFGHDPLPAEKWACVRSYLCVCVCIHCWNGPFFARLQSLFSPPLALRVSVYQCIAYVP